MKLNDALFELMFNVRNTTINKIKLLHPELSPMHLKSLKIINKTSECTGQKMAEMMGRDKAQINRLVKDLVDKSFLYKTENPRDKRSQLLNLTEKGNKIINSFKSVENEIHQALTQDVTKEELEKFINIAQKLNSSLQASKSEKLSQSK